MHSTLPFSSISKDDAATAGGKGASLGEMTQAGIPVPSGFVITAPTFQKFIEDSNIHIEINAILGTVDINSLHTVEYASEKIQALILEEKEFPQYLTDDILNSFRELGTEFVAVRSSATAEDGASAAWAGQLDSYLNTTEETLLTNVRKCWASLFTPRAIFYRFEKKLDQTHISVAVVVQKMVNSDAAGIAFSVHPVTEDRNQIIIEAALGLGEAVVSGEITPDSYVTTKTPRAILHKSITPQTRGLFRKVGGGNEWVEIQKDIGDRQVLSDEQILALSETVVMIENHYGFPCDIEWAMEGGKIYIVQSRPITTLSHTDHPDPAAAYISSVPDWFKSIGRPNTLFDASLLLGLYRFGLKEETGVEFFSQVITYKNAFATYFRSKAQVDSLLEGGLLRQMDTPGHVARLAEKGIDSYREADRIIALAMDIKEYSDVQKYGKEILAGIENNYRYATLIPYWTLNAIEHAGYSPENPGPYHEAFEKFEPLRADTRMLTFREKLYPVLWSVIAKKFNLSNPELLFSLTRWEFERMLDTDELPSEEILTQRQNGCVAWFPTNANELSFSYEKAIFDRVWRLGLENFTGTQLTGFVAQKGYTKGVARLLFVTDDAKDFNDGDIIISTSTSPALMPFMIRCGGIVCDEGGVASHAAIISRELKKPCIIGTKFATQVIKDGDMVEVDADNGVVRIVVD